MTKLFANSEDPDQMPFCGVWSGSALSANYPFGSLQAKIGYVVAYLIYILYSHALIIIHVPAEGGINPVAIDFTVWIVTACPALKLSYIVGAGNKEQSRTTYL